MDLINGISLYSASCSEVRKKLKETMGITTEENKVTETKTMNATSDLKAKDVLDFMANQSITVKAEIQKQLKVNSQYNINCSSDEYTRISNSMKNFEQAYELGLQTLNTDFASLNLSDNFKNKVVLKSLNTFA
jgi:hypothetical protein